MSDQPSQPVWTEYAGNGYVGVYAVIGTTLTVYFGGFTKSADLNQSNPESLAEILLNALLYELAARGVDLDAE